MSRLFVVVQFLCIGLLLWPLGPIRHLWGSLLVLAGLIIGYAAVRIQPHGNFNIRPDLKDGSILITEGIYRYIRHPMYLSVLTSTLGLAIFYGGYLKMAVYAILLINMLLKLFYEEKLWRQHGDEYRQYSQGTKRLIPFLF